MAQFGPSELSREEIEKKIAALENTPLFMTDLPKDTDNPYIAALQDLIFEGTPDGRSAIQFCDFFVLKW